MNDAISLLFGPGELEVDIEGVEVLPLVPRHLPELDDPEETIVKALEKPIGSEPLLSLANRAQSACVVLSDKTRPIPYRTLLPPFLETLHAAGLSPESTRLLIATGIHSPMTDREIDDMVGGDVVGRYQVLNHRGREDRSLLSLGMTKAGIPVHVNETYLQADLKILTGLIEPHLLAGYSGGGKSILPGLCGCETMRHMHGPKMIGHPKARNGIVPGNPFREACEEVGQIAGADFILNITTGMKKQVTGVFAGDLEKAWRQGVNALQKQVQIHLAHRPGVVVTSAGGQPTDRTFYQSVKSLEVAADLVKPGGAIVLASECCDGAGSDAFDTILGDLESPEKGLERIQSDGFFVVDQWIVQHFCQAASHARIFAYIPGIEPGRLRNWFLKPVQSVEEGLKKSLGVNRHAEVAVLPKRPRVVPRIGRHP